MFPLVIFGPPAAAMVGLGLFWLIIRTGNGPHGSYRGFCAGCHHRHHYWGLNARRRSINAWMEHDRNCRAD